MEPTILRARRHYAEAVPVRSRACSPIHQFILVRKNFDQISASSGLTTEFNQFVRIQGPLRVGIMTSYLILALRDYVLLGEVIAEAAVNSILSGNP